MPCAPTRLSCVSVATVLIAGTFISGPALAGGYLKLGDIKGESTASSRGGEMEILSFSWGETNDGTFLKGSKIKENAAGDRNRSLAVEREMKESGEKGGTEDINIGVGELQEMTNSKSMDSDWKEQPPMKWDNTKQKSAARTKEHDKRSTWVERASPAPRGAVRVKVKMPWTACRVGTRYPMVELGEGSRVYKLHGAVVASCSGDADDRPTEEVAFYYNRISF